MSQVPARGEDLLENQLAIANNQLALVQAENASLAAADANKGAARVGGRGARAGKGWRRRRRRSRRRARRGARRAELTAVAERLGAAHEERQLLETLPRRATRGLCAGLSSRAAAVGTAARTTRGCGSRTRGVAPARGAAPARGGRRRRGGGERGARPRGAAPDVGGEPRRREGEGRRVGAARGGGGAQGVPRGGAARDGEAGARAAREPDRRDARVARGVRGGALPAARVQGAPRRAADALRGAAQAARHGADGGGGDAVRAHPRQEPPGRGRRPLVRAAGKHAAEAAQAARDAQTQAADADAAAGGRFDERIGRAQRQRARRGGAVGAARAADGRAAGGRGVGRARHAARRRCTTRRSARAAADALAGCQSQAFHNHCVLAKVLVNTRRRPANVLADELYEEAREKGVPISEWPNWVVHRMSGGEPQPVAAGRRLAATGARAAAVCGEWPRGDRRWCAQCAMVWARPGRRVPDRDVHVAPGSRAMSAREAKADRISAREANRSAPRRSTGSATRGDIREPRPRRSLEARARRRRRRRENIRSDTHACAGTALACRRSRWHGLLAAAGRCLLFRRRAGVRVSYPPSRSGGNRESRNIFPDKDMPRSVYPHESGVTCPLVPR